MSLGPQEPSTLSPLMAARVAAFNYARADIELAAAVQVARAAKFSWRAIGETIGLSAEAARRRYGGLEPTVSRARLMRRIVEGALGQALHRSAPAHHDQRDIMDP